MYLNIINNTSFDSQRARKKIIEKIENEEDNNENVAKSMEVIEFKSFSSIFYGELTKNWLSINTI